MAADKYAVIDAEMPFSFELDIYSGIGNGGTTTTLPIDQPLKWQPSVTETVAAPAPDTTVVLPTVATPTNQVATTSTPAVIAAIQGAVNGVANALNLGSPATPPYVANNAAIQAEKEAALKAQKKNLITVGIVVLVIAVLSYFAFKKK